MKKILIPVFAAGLIAISGYFLFRACLPHLLARAVVSKSLASYLPGQFRKKVKTIHAPINNGAEAMLKKMDESGISLDQVLAALDNTTEEDAYAFLDEVNKTQPRNTNEVFDIAKKYFHGDFDIEPFRAPFNQHFGIVQIRKAIALANVNRREKKVDLKTARKIVKEILRQKEKERQGR